MADKSDAEIEISDSQDKNKSDRDDPSPSLSDIVEVKIDVDESQSIGEKVKPDAASGDTASPTKTATMESMDFVSFFPEKITEDIFLHLSFEDLECCERVSVLWSRVANNCLLRRRKHLKTNWANGKYSIHSIPFTGENAPEFGDLIKVEEVLYTKLIPTENDFGFHYPFIGKRKGTDGPLVFYLMNLDSTLNRTFEFIQYVESFEELFKACVMKGCVAWVSNIGACYYYDGQRPQDSRVTKVTNLDRIECSTDDYEKTYYEENNYDYEITMDTVDIVVWNKFAYLKVWCKQTNEMKLDTPGLLDDKHWSMHCSLFDGRLIVSIANFIHVYEVNESDSTKIEIFKLRNDAVHENKYTFDIEGVVQFHDSNKQFFIFEVITINDSFIKVMNKDTYEIAYSFSYNSGNIFPHPDSNRELEMQKIGPNGDHIILLQDGRIQKSSLRQFQILDLISGVWHPVLSSTENLCTVHESLVVRRNVSNDDFDFELTNEVLDWKGNGNPCYSLESLEPLCEDSEIVMVNELMVVVLDKNGDQYEDSDGENEEDIFERKLTVYLFD